MTSTKSRHVPARASSSQRTRSCVQPYPAKTKMWNSVLVLLLLRSIYLRYATTTLSPCLERTGPTSSTSWSASPHGDESFIELGDENILSGTYLSCNFLVGRDENAQSALKLACWSDSFLMLSPRWGRVNYPSYSVYRCTGNGVLFEWFSLGILSSCRFLMRSCKLERKPDTAT